ncbi:hypothetical protein ACOJBO_02090 [Rhizobium beringeri]
MDGANDRLKIRLTNSNAYVEALIDRALNGLTIFTAMVADLGKGQLRAPELSWGDTIRHDRASYQRPSWH